jgi:hypothetical protein
MSDAEGKAPLPEPPKPPRRFVSALKDDVNKVGAAAIAAAWIATGMMAVPFVGIAAEAAYLLFVPESSWFRKRVRARHKAAEAEYRRRLHEQVARFAGSSYSRSYDAMLRIRESVAKETDPEDETSGEMLQQLDYMLEKYSLFAYQMVQYQRYLEHLAGGREGNPADLAQRLVEQANQQLARLHSQLDRTRDDPTRAVIQQNIDVLDKKRALIERLGALVQNLSLHLQLFRNSFDLVGGLVQTRAPGEVLNVINDAISRAELTSTLSEQSGQIDEEIRQLRMEVLQ